jgi:hypothetical protein
MLRLTRRANTASTSSCTSHILQYWYKRKQEKQAFNETGITLKVETLKLPEARKYIPVDKAGELI